MNRLLSLFVLLVVGSAALAMDIWPPPIQPGKLGSFDNPLYPSDVVVVPIVSDVGLLGLDAVLEVVSGPATIVGAMSKADCRDYGWDPTLSFEPDISPRQAEIGAGSFNPAGPGVVGYFLLHGEGGGEITLRLLAGNKFGGGADANGQEPTVGGEIVIYQMAEPNCWDETECSCQQYGDATCDGSLNLADLFALKTAFGKCAPWTAPNCCADFNHDGCVNLGDLYIVRAGWGLVICTDPSTGNQNCPQ